ncbi:hypothetical protein R70211_06794 [Paraburkholderia domus]|uniref:Cytosine-specific methyltransferase n=2 Tax=Paraburkholderia domus TaxID=2793075 RepID=A0A9N8R3T5_9BURK|nr:DNA (cytosine-5-)-methyltransferase [Burkholderia sp. R-70211]CAE6958948.1 hypothetical protein R70211_06794 [Paraburkholderia domus]
MRYMSVCSGIEAATVAWRPLGWSAHAFAEIDPFACAVLAHHFGGVPNLGDVMRFQEWPDAAFDVLVGGTPCQSFSIAGLRKGLDDPRGNLTLVLLAIARRYAPRWLVYENVPGVLSSDSGRDFETFLAGLGELGYGFAYRVLDAQYFGVAQRRRRVFVVGCLGNWRAAAAVLFERDSLLGHPAPRRKSRQDVTGTLSARARSGGGLGTDLECDGGLIPDIARALTSSNERIDAESETLLVAHSLRCESFDASEDGTGRGTPLIPIPFDTTQITSPANVSHPRSGDPCHPLAATAHVPAIAFDCKASHGGGAVSDVHTPTLRGMNNANSRQNGGGQIAVAFNWNAGGKQTSLGYDPDAQTTGALIAGPKPAVALPYTLAIRGRDDGRNLEVRSDDVANALITPNGGRDGVGIGALMTPTLQVRRLTPRECERLMGFADDYTLIPLPLKGRQTRVRWSADGARYRALGNSIAVPVLAWIAQRIERVEKIFAEISL